MKRKYNLFRGKVSKLGAKMTYTGSLSGTKNGGTCPTECEGCYAQKGNFLFPNVIKGLTKITEGIRNERSLMFSDFQNQIFNARIPITMIRIHHSGDFVDFDHWMRWIEMAMRNPQIKFYTYTKRYDIVRAFFNEVGELPKNFFLNVSIWKEKGQNEWNEFKTHRNVNAFIADLEDPKRKVVRCPAYCKNGKMVRDKDGNPHTCDDCGLCMSSKHLEIHCWKH